MLFNLLTTKKLLQKLEKEEEHDKKLLHLTANENIMSPLATRFHHSVLGTRYDFGRGEQGVTGDETFSYFSAPVLFEIQDIFDKAKYQSNKMLNAQFTTLSCLSGLHAMMCALLATTKPGDTVLIVKECDGGHFCTHKMLHITGRKFIYATYDQNTHFLNIKNTVKDICNSKIKVLYFDVSVNLTPLPIKELRKRLPKDAIIIYDASHTLGLIMGGEFQNPLKEGADIISANTHKTFPGPHKGLLAFRSRELGQRVHEMINDSLYSTVHTNSELALAISIIEFYLYGRSYAKQIIKNSNALGFALEKLGLNVRKTLKHYSYNHQVHIFVDMKNTDIVSNFLKNGISVNTSNALGDRMFLRLGTQEITKRGMKERDMKQIALFIKKIILGKNIRDEVMKFNDRFNKVFYCLPY